MKRFAIKISLVVSAWLMFSAHEFWLMPSQFRVKAGQTVQLNLLVGEDFHGERWEARQKRTQRVLHHFGKQKQDLTAQALASDSAAINVACTKAGTHLLAMRSNNSFIELEGEKFNAYLEEDGIDNILTLRRQKNELNKPARELYQRCAKALLQVGKKTDDTYVINCGMPLEIIPLQNPYTLRAGDSLSVRILFNNQPLPDAVVRSWHKMDETKTNQRRFRTDTQGIVRIPLDTKGYWMISLVRMVENADTNQSDYQSYWGSLTFEL